MHKTSSYIFLLLTPIYFWFAHYFAVFPHEYCHSLVASLAGYKDHFWQIDYGGTSFWNLVFLVNIDENVNYTAMFAAHQDWLVALTAFAGPGIGNGLTYFLSLWGMTKQSIQSRPWLFYFFFWWNVNSIGNFIDYVPSRTFSEHDDMANLAHGLHISPWWIMVTLGYLVIFAFWYFYTHTLFKTCKMMKFSTHVTYSILLILVTYVLFKWYGGGSSGLNHSNEISHFVSQLSIWLIIPVIVACGPQRKWVQEKLA